MSIKKFNTQMQSNKTGLFAMLRQVQQLKSVGNGTVKKRDWGNWGIWGN